MNKYQEAYESIGSIVPSALVIGRLEDLPKHFQAFKELVDKETERQLCENKLIAGSEWICVIGHENDAAGIYEGQSCFITAVNDSHVWFEFKAEKYSSGCDFGDSRKHFLACYRPKE